MEALGLDIGGTGIKGAPVDSQSGELLAERFRLLTPQPATPQAVADTVAAVAAPFNWQGPIGCGFPAVIRAGIAHTAANVDAAWIGTDARELFSQETGCQCAVANDADVAGLAEMRFGAGQGRAGVVLVVTLGTGIGSALFSSGQLVPNTELGHIELEGMEAEQWAAESAREREELSWKKWAKRVDQFLQRMQDYFWPASAGYRGITSTIPIFSMLTVRTTASTTCRRSRLLRFLAAIPTGGGRCGCR